jgi:hypothetical protein
MTEIKIASTPRIGLHLSAEVSAGLKTSSPGGCKIEIQTLPSGKRLGCHISVIKTISGGEFG